MIVKPFVDTNILIYAHDREAGARRDSAAELVRHLWQRGGAVLSTQVLHEFYVNVTRKIPSPLTPAKARGIVENYCAWQVEISTCETIRQATDIQERHQLSFWDALIVATAAQGGADVLFSEDLNAGQLIEGVRVINPFTADTETMRALLSNATNGGPQSG